MPEDSAESGTRTDRSDVDRMNEYKVIRRATRDIREWALAADDEAQDIMWIAAGGRGTGHPEELRRIASSIRTAADQLEELAAEAPAPREVRDDE